MMQLKPGGMFNNPVNTNVPKIATMK